MPIFEGLISVSLEDGTIVDFDDLYPKEEQLLLNYITGYDPKDDIYGDITEEERKSYGLY